jgi:N-sulfoglucosamine sulfohydrolase
MVNLIILDCHDLGQHIGAYGWKTVATHNLDALASHGIRFANHFCTAPQCSPSRAGLYTGRYAHANGMFGLAHDPFNWRLNEDEIHLAKHLRTAGYETALIGIQHLTQHDPQSVRELGFNKVILDHKPDGVAEHVSQFLTNGPEKPFFLKIGFEYPHRDPNGYFKQAPPDRSLGVKVPPYLPDTLEAQAEFAELQGVIRAMDLAVGKIWEAISQAGLLEDTWIIFTTDHGIAMPMAKCTLYDRGIETAMIMYAEPFGLVGGKVYEQLISNVDLVPTLLDMLGIRPPTTLQGESYANLLRNNTFQERDAIFAEKTYHTAYEPQRAIRTKQFKLIWNLEVGIINVPGDVMHSPIFPLVIDAVTQERPYFELYDLLNDPQEHHNLAGHPEYDEVLKTLKQELISWMRATQDPLLDGPIASPFFKAGYHQLNELST